MKAIKRASPFVFAVLLAVVPLVVRNAYVLHLMILVGVYVLLTQGLNVIFGYLGLLSLGQQAFLAIGGYVTAMLALKVGFSFWLILPIAILSTIVLGLAIGYITLRFRSAYFVIVTIAVADIVRLLPLNIDYLGGPPGLRGIPRPTIKIGGLIDYEFTGKAPYYYLVWAMALVAIVVTSRLVKSRQGRAFSAIKEHEPLAKAIGVDPFRHAMLALAVAVATAGAAGAFMAAYVTHVSPELGSFHWTLTMLTMIAIGGQGTIWGPVLGSFIFVFLPEYLRVINEFRMPIYGVILMITVLFFPGGLWPLIQRGVERLSPGVRDRDTQTVDSPEVIDAEYAEAQSLASEEA